MSTGHKSFKMKAKTTPAWHEFQHWLLMNAGSREAEQCREIVERLICETMAGLMEELENADEYGPDGRLTFKPGHFVERRWPATNRLAGVGRVLEAMPDAYRVKSLDGDEAVWPRAETHCREN